MDATPPRRERSFLVRCLAFTGWDALNPGNTGKSVRTESAMVELAILKFFGFVRYFGYRVFSLILLVVFLAIFGLVLRFTDVYGGRGRDKAFFILSFLPYLYLVLGPLVFLFTLLFCHGGLWRFLSVSVEDEYEFEKAEGLTESFRNDAWTLKYGAVSFSSLFMVIKVILTVPQGSSILDVIPILYWSYLVLFYVSTVGVNMLGVRNLSILLDDISTLLGKTDILKRKTLVSKVDEYNEAVERFSKRISPFVFSQIIITVFSLSSSIVVVTLYWSSGLLKLACGSGDFVCLSVLQITSFWRLMDDFKSLNKEAKRLEQYAKQTHKNAWAKEYDDDGRKQEGMEIEIKLLKFNAYYMEGIMGSVTLFGRPIDTTFTDWIFPIQLAFAVYVGGPLVSAVITPFGAAPPSFGAPPPLYGAPPTIFCAPPPT